MKLILAALSAALIAAPALAASGKSASLSADALRAALQAHPEVMLDFVRTHKKEVFDILEEAAQEEQARRQAEEEEKEKKDFEDSFKNPLKPTIPDVSRIRGNKDAKYTLVEYSDFECPYCGRGFKTVEALRQKYGNDLRFVYKELPLPIHQHSMIAAKYFEAAALQSPEKAWALHDKMFQNQTQLGDDFLKQSCKALGLNMKKLEKDVQSKEVADKIQADMDEAHSLGFTGTPGFVLNGIPVRGAYPVDYFEMIIDRLDGKPADAKDEKN